MHQEREYPGARDRAPSSRNPDFAALARAYGASWRDRDRTADFAPAFERCLAAGKPALIDLVVDQDQISPRATLSGLRAAALKQ